MGIPAELASATDSEHIMPESIRSGASGTSGRSSPVLAAFSAWFKTSASPVALARVRTLTGKPAEKPRENRQKSGEKWRFFRGPQSAISPCSEPKSLEQAIHLWNFMSLGPGWRQPPKDPPIGRVPPFSQWSAPQADDRGVADSSFILHPYLIFLFEASCRPTTKVAVKVAKIASNG